MFYYLNYGITFLATVFIVIGVLALLTNLGILPIAIWKWWPVLFIVFGVFALILKKKEKKIAIHHIFQKIATNGRVQEKLKKIIDTVDEVVDKKLDEWHEEATSAKKSSRK